jgi:enoyl-[acyl-carrier protein] reductase I
MAATSVYSATKAAVRSLARTLSTELGPRGIRVNAVSAGPIRTLAGSGIGEARAMFAFMQKHSPLRRGVTLDELGGSALYLLSDLSGGVTGEIHYVDSGYNIVLMPRPDDLKSE